MRQLQVHEVLEAQAKRLNDDALQLAVMRDRLQGDSPSAHAAPGAGNASTEFSFSRSAPGRGQPHAPCVPALCACVLLGGDLPGS